MKLETFGNGLVEAVEPQPVLTEQDFEKLLRAAKLCRSYFFEDPNRAYEILAEALREIES